MLKKTVHRTSQKLQNMDQALNGPNPRFVSYKENGKDVAVEKADINAEHCHSYIGKMRTDGEGTYSDEVITALLNYFITHTKKDEKIVIELANKVSELLNKQENQEEYQNVDEQREHMMDIVKKINKKRMKDIEIVDIEENNPLLFWILKSQGISGLSTLGRTPKLCEKDFTSFDIAKYLYRICQNDPVYFQAIKDLKPNELKEKTGDCDYYGMIELAIRINALLHGITLQGGVGRQKKYDALILKHINPYISDYPSLNDFRTFCETKLSGKSFGGLYFDTEKAEQLTAKIAQKHKIASRLKTIGALTIGAILGVLGTEKIGDYLESQKIEKQQQETINEIFENKRVTRSGDMGGGEYTGEAKIEELNRYVETVYERFLFRYGSIGDFSEEQFKAKIVDCINNQDVLNILSDSYTAICVQDDIIDNYLIQNNIGEFRTANVPTIPYEVYKPYREAFINTILLEEDITTTREEEYKTMGPRGGNASLPSIDDIGEYSPKETGYYGSMDQKYRLGVTQHGYGGKQYVLATGMYYGEFDKEQNLELTSSRAKELAMDFLRQTEPVINQLLNQYLIRYYRRDNNRIINENGPTKESLPRKIEDLLIKDFLKQGKLDKIQSKQTDKIIEYLDEFVITNKDMLQQMTGDINKDLLPNGMLKEYEATMQNTINDYDTIFRNHSWLPSSEVTKEGVSVQYIGKYKASDEKIYDVGYVTIDGKQYLYADDAEKVAKIYRHKNSFGAYYGNIVALDYFKTKSAFLQKKYLLEKKLKSASQKYVEKPLKNDSLSSFSDQVKNNPKRIVPR